MLGDRSDDSFTRLDIIVAPCNYLNAYAGHEGDPIAPECIRDLDAQREYMDSFLMNLYVTDEVFVKDQYGE